MTRVILLFFFFFFFNDTATTEIYTPLYTLSLHDALPICSRAGVAPTAPDSYTSTRRGAWVARARLHARLGRPIPTNTTSPSTSSRAATLAIISSAVYAPSEPVIHPGAAPFLRLEPRGQIRLFLQVRRPIGHAAHEVVEVAFE